MLIGVPELEHSLQQQHPSHQGVYSSLGVCSGKPILLGAPCDSGPRHVLRISDKGGVIIATCNRLLQLRQLTRRSIRGRGLSYSRSLRLKVVWVHEVRIHRAMLKCLRET